MSDFERPDPRDRPPDPAGTRPKVDPESLLPVPVEPEAVDGEAVEEQVDEHLEEAIDRLEEADEHPGEALVAGSAGGGAVAPAIPRETRHTPRFQFLFGALLALGLIAIAGAVAVIVGGGSSDDSPLWSPWKPGGSDPVAQIASHVAPEYRLPDGSQLVAVTGGPLEVASLPMQIALRSDPASGGNIQLLEGHGVLFRLCGLGPQCSISEGKASTKRHLLLRREALELALYTFRYVKDVDQVVVFMPPRKGQEPDQALLFRRGDVRDELDRPLGATLAGRTPSVAGVAASPDASLVNRLTISTLYRFSLTQANQDASVFLVLQPLETSTQAPGSSTGEPTSTGSAKGSSGSSASASSGAGSSSAKHGASGK